MAESHGHLTSFIEAPDDKSLTDLLYPKIHQALRKLSTIENAKAATNSAMRALRGFAGAFRISVGDVSLAVDPEAGTADSGILEYDLSDLFVRIGEAAQSADKAWTLLIDEIQYLSEAELSALIVAIHRVNQKKLPVMFFGAGLPQIAALAGDMSGDDRPEVVAVVLGLVGLGRLRVVLVAGSAADGMDVDGHRQGDGTAVVPPPGPCVPGCDSPVARGS